MKTINPKIKIYLTSGVLIVLVFVVCFFVVRPLISKNISLRKEIKKQEKSLQELQKPQNSFQQLKKESETLKERVASIEEKLLDSDKTIVFIEDIEQLAKQAGGQLSLSISSCQEEMSSDNKPRSKSQKEKKKESTGLCFQISLSGSIPVISNFLYNLENLPYYIDTKEVRLNYNKEKEGWYSAIQIKVYTIKDLPS
jgi:Tfp pilus assembly protein PilO